MFRKGFPIGNSTLYYSNNSVAWEGEISGVDIKIDNHDLATLIRDQPFREPIRISLD